MTNKTRIPVTRRDGTVLGYMFVSKPPKITIEMNTLYAMSIDQVRGIVARSHRVADLDGLTKGELISMSLEDTFGRRAMTAFNA